MKLDRISSSAHLKQRLGWRHPPLCSWSTHLEDQFCIFPTTTIIWPRSPAQLSRQLVFWKCSFFSQLHISLFCHLWSLLSWSTIDNKSHRRHQKGFKFFKLLTRYCWGWHIYIILCKIFIESNFKKVRFMHFRIFQGERTKKRKPEKIWLLLFRNDIGRWTGSLIDLRLYEEIILWRLLLTSSFTLPLSCGDFRSLWIFILLQKLKMLCSANISPDAKSLVMSVCFAK